MADLVFTIKTPAELEGAEKAAQALEVSIGKAKGLGKEYGELETRLKATQASIEAFKSSQAASSTTSQEAAKQTQSLVEGQADLSKLTKELGENVSKAKDKVDLFNISKKDWLSFSRGLGVQVPILGRAVALLANPLAAMTAALGVTVGLFAELHRQSKALATDVKIKPVADDTAALAKSFQEAATASDEYFTKLKGGQTALEKLNEASNKQKTLLQEQAAAQKAIAEAEKDLALARLERMKQSGEISAGEFERRSAALGVTSPRDTQKQRQSEIAAARGDLAGQETALRNIDRGAAARNQIAAETQRDFRKRQLDEVNAEVTALKEKRDAGGLRTDEFDRLRSLERLRTNLELEVEEQEAAVKKATKATQDTEKAILDLEKSITALKKKIDEMVEADRIRTEGENTSQSIRSQAARIRGEARGDEAQEKDDKKAEREESQRKKKLGREADDEITAPRPESLRAPQAAVESAGAELVTNQQAMLNTVVNVFNSLNTQLADAQSRLKDSQNV